MSASTRPESLDGPEPSGFSSAETMPLPRVFGRLLLLKLIARGGMGDVYLAATTGIEGAERPCVVKTVRRDHIHDGSFLARFLDEARVQSQLNHPGVAQVLEASTDENGEPYTVVEHVEGRSLSDVRARAIQLGARLGWAEAVAIAIEMANALGHVHERSGSDGTPLGIVHRDLSPQNVMVGYVGEVKLIDFGTARGQNRKCHTVAGVVFAKPGYVAPEVARQQVGDARIDLYALGIMLWELCAGRRFLTGDPQKHLEEAAAWSVKVPELADLVEAPKELDTVIQRLVANDPDERSVSASAAAIELSRVLGLATPGPNGERSVRGRIQALMRTLWPHEPARSRSEFAKLLKGARGLHAETQTPVSSRVMEIAAQHMNDDPSILSGTPYRLLSKIGEGASGVVWAGEHVELGRKLAIKVLLPGHGSASDAIERFRREARAVASLSHPNLVQLYDFGRSLDGRVFLAMELLHGSTVDKHLKDSRGMDLARGRKPRDRLVPRARGGARSGARAPGPQAGQSVPDRRRDGEAARLRSGDGARRRRGSGRKAAAGLRDLRHPRIHVAGASRGRERRRAVRPLRPRLCPLRARDGHTAVRGIARRRDGQATARAGRVALRARAAARDPGGRGRRRDEAPREEEDGANRDRDGSAPRARRDAPDAGEAPRPSPRRREHDRGERDGVEHRRRPRLVPRDARDAARTGRAGGELGAPGGRHRGRTGRHSGGACDRNREPRGPSADPAYRARARGRDPRPGFPTPCSPAPPVLARAATPTPPSTLTSPSPSPSPSTPTPTQLAASASPPHPTPERPDLAELADARPPAQEHPSDRHALKAWATAASRAGAMREARHAGEAWALKDESAEPRLFLASVLDATGHRSDAKVILEQWLDLHPDSAEAKKVEARFGQSGPRAERVTRKTIER